MPSKFHKYAGILDRPNPTIAPDVWSGKNDTLAPAIARQMKENLYKIIPPGYTVKRMFIIGSITGYKYGPSSDIDVTVQIDPFDETMGKTKWAAAINGINAPGTRHPVNYFFQPFNKDTTDNEAWASYPFGVYDVLGEYWLKTPPDRSTVRDPKVQFATELKAASMVDREFKRQVTEYLRARSVLRAWENLPKGSALRELEIDKKSREIRDRRKKLIAFADELDEGRKLVYQWGWGTPRNSFKNIVFKLIEHGKYGPLFEQIEPL